MSKEACSSVSLASHPPSILIVVSAAVSNSRSDSASAASPSLSSPMEEPKSWIYEALACVTRIDEKLDIQTRELDGLKTSIHVLKNQVQAVSTQMDDFRSSFSIQLAALDLQLDHLNATFAKGIDSVAENFSTKMDEFQSVMEAQMERLLRELQRLH